MSNCELVECALCIHYKVGWCENPIAILANSGNRPLAFNATYTAPREVDPNETDMIKKYNTIELRECGGPFKE